MSVVVAWIHVTVIFECRTSQVGFDTFSKEKLLKRNGHLSALEIFTWINIASALLYKWVGHRCPSLMVFRVLAHVDIVDRKSSSNYVHSLSVNYRLTHIELYGAGYKKIKCVTEYFSKTTQFNFLFKRFFPILTNSSTMYLKQ